METYKDSLVQLYLYRRELLNRLLLLSDDTITDTQLEKRKALMTVEYPNIGVSFPLPNYNQLIIDSAIGRERLINYRSI